MSQARVMTIALDRRFSHLKRTLAHGDREAQIEAYEKVIERAGRKVGDGYAAAAATRAKRAIEALDYPAPGCAPDRPLISNEERVWLTDEQIRSLAGCRSAALRAAAGRARQGQDLHPQKPAG